MADPSERLPEYFKSPYNTEGERLNAIIEAFGSEFAEYEAELDEVTRNKFIDTADEPQLEKLASLFQTSRRDDERLSEFRARLKVELRSQLTSATPSEIIQMISVVLGLDTENIELQEPPSAPPATVNARAPVDTVGSLNLRTVNLDDLLDKITAAGINGNFILFTETVGIVFVTLATENSDAFTAPTLSAPVIVVSDMEGGDGGTTLTTISPATKPQPTTSAGRGTGLSASQLQDLGEVVPDDDTDSFMGQDALAVARSEVEDRFNITDAEYSIGRTGTYLERFVRLNVEVFAQNGGNSELAQISDPASGGSLTFQSILETDTLPIDFGLGDTQTDTINEDGFSSGVLDPFSAEVDGWFIGQPSGPDSSPTVHEYQFQPDLGVQDTTIDGGNTRPTLNQPTGANATTNVDGGTGLSASQLQDLSDTVPDDDTDSFMSQDAFAVARSAITSRLGVAESQFTFEETGNPLERRVRMNVEDFAQGGRNQAFADVSSDASGGSLDFITILETDPVDVAFGVQSTQTSTVSSTGLSSAILSPFSAEIDGWFIGEGAGASAPPTVHRYQFQPDFGVQDTEIDGGNTLSSLPLAGPAPTIHVDSAIGLSASGLQSLSEGVSEPVTQSSLIQDPYAGARSRIKSRFGVTDSEFTFSKTGNPLERRVRMSLETFIQGGGNETTADISSAVSGGSLDILTVLVTATAEYGVETQPTATTTISTDGLSSSTLSPLSEQTEQWLH